MWNSAQKKLQFKDCQAAHASAAHFDKHSILCNRLKDFNKWWVGVRDTFPLFFSSSGYNVYHTEAVTPSLLLLHIDVLIRLWSCATPLVTTNGSPCITCTLPADQSATCSRNGPIAACHVRMYPYASPPGPTKVTSGPIAMRLIPDETVNPLTYITTICAMCVYSKALTLPGLGTTLYGCINILVVRLKGIYVIVYFKRP